MLAAEAKFKAMETYCLLFFVFRDRREAENNRSDNILRDADDVARCTVSWFQHFFFFRFKSEIPG